MKVLNPIFLFDSVKSVSNIRSIIYIAMVFILGFTVRAGSAAGNEPGEAHSVHVVLDEWQLEINKNHVRPGRVTFTAVNQGRFVHEMVVIKTDLPLGAFRVEGGKVKEGAVGVVMGEIEGLPAQSEQSLTLDLAEGTYVLFCNNLEKDLSEGHYQKGMRVVLTVSGP